MKRKKKFLPVVLALTILAASAATISTAALQWNEKQKKEAVEQKEPEPLVISTPKEQSGKIIIYQDDKVAYEYEGPIRVNQKNGEYRIEVHTGICSCFEEDDNIKNSSEVDE